MVQSVIVFATAGTERPTLQTLRVDPVVVEVAGSVPMAVDELRAAKARLESIGRVGYVLVRDGDEVRADTFDNAVSWLWGW